VEENPEKMKKEDLKENATFAKACAVWFVSRLTQRKEHDKK
jgi:hypothetical protein